MFFRKNLMIGGAELLCRIPLIFTLGLLARTVGAEAYGAWALIVVFQQLVSALAGQGLSSSLSRLAAAGDPKSAYGLLLLAMRRCGWGIILALPLAWSMTGAMGTLLGIPPVFRWLLPLSVLFAAGGVMDGLLDAYFKTREAVRRQVLFVLARTLAEILVVLGVVLVGANGSVSPDMLLGGYMLAVLGMKSLLYPWLIRQGDVTWPPKQKQEQFLSYGLPMIPVLLLSWFISQGDRLILGQFFETTQLGVYTFGASVASYVIFLSYAIYPLLLGRASRLYDQGQEDALARLFQSSQELFLLLFLPTLISIGIFRHEIILLTAGPDYIAAADILWVLTIGVGLEGIFGVYQYVFHLVRQPRWIFWLTLTYAVLLAGCMVAVGLLGGNGVAAAWSIVGAGMIFQGGRYLLSRRFHPLPLRGGVVITLLLGVLIGLGLEWLTEAWGWLAKGFLLVGTWSLTASVLWQKRGHWLDESRGISEPVGG